MAELLRWHGFKLSWLCFILTVIFCTTVSCTKKGTLGLIEDITDFKDLKKLLRTKTNVLILFTKSGKDAVEITKVFTDVAEEVRGQATLCYVDCTSEAKKLCKKLKVLPEPFVLKHYRNGEFNKDYDRKDTVVSMVNFLKDPTGDIPWDEDTSLNDIVHVPDTLSFAKLLRKESRPLLMMFYAPWCGFCNRLKPQYAEAASELKGQSILAAMDVNKPENSVLRQQFNITGFPTLMYFEHGNLKYKYEGENTKEGLVKFMKNPEKPLEKPTEEEWSEVESDVVHITAASFKNDIIKDPSVLVMFYAPWCGHCKAMKPEYVDAAAKMKEKEIKGILAAVDATKESPLATQFNIKGYPTVKYFKNGEFAFDVNFRTADKIIEFMNDPKEQPPPPPPELPWSETESEVHHLETETFKTLLKRKKHALVMFYAPWCGHCKKAKPEFVKSAEYFKDDSRVAFAAVDCTTQQQVCSQYGVKGYPTLKYFSYLKHEKAYEGGRTEADFIAFMKDPQNPDAGMPPPPPSPEDQWAEVDQAKSLHHLTESKFDPFLEKQDSVLVMFYAPWCGHCNAMKPAYAEAASLLKVNKVQGVLATVDATIERGLQAKFEVKGFPTLKYFRNGKFVADYSKQRTVDDLVSFMKNPPPAAVKEEL